MEKISASDARETADVKNGDITKEDLNICYMAIKEGAKMGLYHVTVYRAITKKATLELRGNGYTVHVISGKTHIGWECTENEE